MTQNSNLRWLAIKQGILRDRDPVGSRLIGKAVYSLSLKQAWATDLQDLGESHVTSDARQALSNGIKISGTNLSSMEVSSRRIPAMRWFWAFVVFNVYAPVLLAAFQKNTPYLFDAKFVSAMHATDHLVNLERWGWRDHYVWRLLSGVVVTSVVAFLSGAIAKSKGGVVATISNVPSVLIWGVIFYLMTFGGASVEGQRGFAVVSLIAIPVTTWAAFFFGRLGMEFQNAEFSGATVLGIRPYHWAWLIFPIYVYAIGIVFVLVKFLALEFLTWRDASAVGGVISLMGLVPVIVWVLPLVFVHLVLAGNALRSRSAMVKVFANVGVLIGGVAAALIVQGGCFWLLQSLMRWWYRGAI